MQCVRTEEICHSKHPFAQTTGELLIVLRFITQMGYFQSDTLNDGTALLIKWIMKLVLIVVFYLGLGLISKGVNLVGRQLIN